MSGGYPTQFPMGPTSVLGIVTADFGASLHNELAKALDGTFVGGHYNIGIGTGVVDFVLSPIWLEQGPPDLVAKAKEVWPEIEAEGNQFWTVRSRCRWIRRYSDATCGAVPFS